MDKDLPKYCKKCGKLLEKKPHQPEKSFDSQLGTPKTTQDFDLVCPDRKIGSWFEKYDHDHYLVIDGEKIQVLEIGEPQDMP